MGIMDGAANGLKMRLENVGVRPNLAFAIGQVAYVAPRNIPPWVAPAVVSKSEVTWLVSQYEKQLRGMPDGLASIAVIQGLCTRIFGPHGEDMFIGSYPEFSEERWQETVQQQNTDAARILDQARAQSPGFTQSFIDSDLWWDGSQWVSAAVAGPGTDEGPSEALVTSFAASRAVGLLARKYFDTPRDGLGRYREPFMDEAREVDDLSLQCALVGPEGQSLEGFLVQSGDRLGFFDGADLMAESLNEGSPILFSAQSIIAIYCVMDQSIIEASTAWDRLFPVPQDDKLDLVFEFEQDNLIRLEVKPEAVLTDVYRSRYRCALYFVGELDSRLTQRA